MSASLVGSEMCIRDSMNIVCPPPPRCPRMSRTRQRERDCGHRFIHPCICLLYTSDAADDMSV
eukprot:12577341-Alexandrium_andersonii.AAC.1